MEPGQEHPPVTACGVRLTEAVPALFTSAASGSRNRLNGRALPRGPGREAEDRASERAHLLFPGLPNDNYRTSDGPDGNHNVVNMPNGNVNPGNNDNNTSFRVVCHAP